MLFSTGGTDFKKCHNEKPTGVKSGGLGGHKGGCDLGQHNFQKKIILDFDY